MAITYEVRQDLLTVIVGMFDGAPTTDLLTSLVERIEAGSTVAELAVELGETTELASVYPTYLTAEEFAASFVGNLLGDNVDAATLALGEEFVAGLINGGSSRGEAMYTAIQALSAVPEDDATWGQAVTQLNNKVEVATYFALTQNPAGATLEDLRSVTANVDATDESVSLQKMLVDAGLNSVIQELTVGEDDVIGSSANDIFEAEIFDNQNKLQSGDFINGKGGNDTLIAEVGNSAEFAITAKTESVENAFFQVQATTKDANSSDNETGLATIDAQFMNGTTAFWSNLSRADLVIEDIQNNSHLTTIGFRSSDQGDVDYEVYFDNITAPDGTTAGSQLFLEVLDLEAAAATGDKLTNNPYVGVSITVDGVQYDIVGDSAITTTYQDLVDALNAALDAAGLTTVTASLGEEFSKFNSDDGLKYTGTQIVLTNSGSETLEGLGWVVNGTVPADTNVHTAINDAAPSTTSELTQTNVIFDDVGQGSQGGDFLAGNMSTGTSGSNGIQQFNITVQNDSWVDTVSTTNNDLEKVIIVNDDSASTNGDLRIGDVSGNAGLVDVQTVDASAMTGALTLDATLGMGSESLKDKYYDLDDTQNGAGNDNVTFAYSTGNGDDALELTISEEAVAYEDLVLEIDTGTGNDLVDFRVANNTTDLNTNWDEDQAALKNITISTGSGNDTVKAFGDGVVTISTGSGDDVVYSDNSGIETEAATWVFNGGATPALNDIQGEGVTSNGFFLLDPKLTVTFSAGSTGAGQTAGAAAAKTNGFEKTVDIAVNNYVATEADINQALKDAINNDATLNKWLVAEDGPNNSVIVKALVDGVFQANDVSVTISQSAFPTTVASEVQDAYEEFVGNSQTAYTTLLHAGQTTAVQGSGTGYNNNSVLASDTAVNEVQTLSFTGAVDMAAADTVVVTLDDGAAGTTTATFTAAAAITSIDDLLSAMAADATFTGDVTTAGYSVVADTTADTLVFTANAAATQAQDLGTTVSAAITATTTAPTTSGAETTKGNDGLIHGVASNELSADNTINVGAGNDVVALSTNAESTETLVFTGTELGNVDVLNFTAGADTVAGHDVLDFSSYLTTQQFQTGSTSEASKFDIPTTALSAATVATNGISVISFTAGSGTTASQTFEALTASALLAAVNNSNTGTANYGSLGDASLEASAFVAGVGTAGSLVEDSRDHVVLIENSANLGEYKAFYLESSNAAQAAGATTIGDFSSATLIGTIDLGGSSSGTGTGTALDIDNFVG